MCRLFSARASCMAWMSPVAPRWNYLCNATPNHDRSVFFEVARVHLGQQAVLSSLELATQRSHVHDFPPLVVTAHATVRLAGPLVKTKLMFLTLISHITQRTDVPISGVMRGLHPAACEWAIYTAIVPFSELLVSA